MSSGQLDNNEFLDSEMGSEIGTEDDESTELGEEGEEGMGEDEGADDDNSGDFDEPCAVKDGSMIESYDKRELISAQGMEGDLSSLEPYQGMEFDSENAAREFYNAYARCYGFHVRVSKCHHSLCDGSIISHMFVCSKESCHPQKDRELLSKRVGCIARLVIKRQSPHTWVVTKFEKKHNHEVDAPRKVDMKPCVRVRGDGGEIIRQVEHSIDVMAHIVPKLEASAPVVSPNLELYEGMEFESEEAAMVYYYAYAKWSGFTVRISKCRRAQDGSIICRRFVCSKEGYYVRKYGRTKRSRELTRVGCMARLIVKKLDSGVWAVQNFEKEHNHPPFVEGKELSYQPPVHVGTGRRGRPPNSVKALVNRPSALQIENNPQNSMTWRFSKLHHEAIKFAEEGSSSVDVFNVAMFALREASQTVVEAKKSLVSGVGENSNGEQDSDEVIHAASGNPQLDDSMHTTQSLEGNKPVGPGRKKRIRAEEEAVGQDIMYFGEGETKFDGASPWPQRWNIIPSNGGGLSEKKRATIQDVADAIVHKRSRDALQPSDQSPQPPSLSKSLTGRNPLVHAAALAAGARIASPEVAASLIRAVQSRTALHIKTGSTKPSSPHYMQADQEAVTGFCGSGMNRSSVLGDLSIEGGTFDGVGHMDLMDAISSDMVS
ncbi:Protein FAR1-RELATED SEQUENCE 12 [Acorus calamus]|uniref:Protein FAR1-RELATED SEQUENCE 12 n=1 Tax=Acorus calamus TaxID=4465 RepID=A0AAV9ESU6_ACOCL|nr:Protein FAR1-RELATED SEQUENCE 12 [Acorus calamus]